MLSSLMEDLLLPLAREAIELFFSDKKNSDKIFPLALQDYGSCFVTLQKKNKLRGCYGTIFPFQSLLENIQSNALKAAFHDPRFPPLQKDELSEITIELSLLSPPVLVETSIEKDVIAILKPHISGVLLQWKEFKSTFLPFVWSIFPKKEDFFSALKKKAGLSEDFWEEDIEIFTYEVHTLKEIS